MVERVNGTIKSATIKVNSYKDLQSIEKDLNQFLLSYDKNRRHGSLVKELNIKNTVSSNGKINYQCPGKALMGRMSR